MFFHPGDGRTQAFVMLMAAAGVLYAASRLAVFALARPDGSDAGRRAIGQWMPIAATVLAAVCMNHADIALALVLSTSVACLTLAVGMTTWLHPMEWLPPSRKVWPLVFPTALLVLLAGFSGYLAWWHALMLIALGAAIWAVWLETPDSQGELLSPNDLPPTREQAGVVLMLALALTVGGGYLAVRGTLATCSIREFANRLLYPGTLAATIIGPLLILPTLGGVSAVAQRGQPGRAVSALVGTVLLNLCLLLPIAILLWHLRPGDWSHAISKGFNVRWDRAHHLPFDIAAWQIDTVCLIVPAFILISVSLGRWRMGRGESILLILGYGAYIVALAVFGVQQM